MCDKNRKYKVIRSAWKKSILPEDSTTLYEAVRKE